MFTIASYITMTRIVLTPVVFYYIQLQQWSMATIFFMVAASTDLIDGFVARRFNQQSKVGQLLDPIADKCLIMTTLYALLMRVAVGFFQQVVVYFLLSKEVILLVGGGWLKVRYDIFIKPSRLSRAASLAEIFLILFLFANLVWFGQVYSDLFSMVLGCNLLLSVWLLARYALIVYKVR